MRQKEILNGRIVIWGTRALGNLAYYYYKDRAEILCYIDNDKAKWGKTLNGIRICPPDELHGKEAAVILALRNGVDVIERQLYEEFGIESYVLFQMEETLHIKGSTLVSEEIPEDTCVISFSGGLGNQMFQYALFKNLQLKGKHVLADLESYQRVGVMGFQLPDVFPNIRLEMCTRGQKKKLLEKNAGEGKKEKKFIIYKENAALLPDEKKEADMSLLDVTGGLIAGMHQNYRFAELIREELLESFQFNCCYDDKLKSLTETMAEENAVGVHLRRGDYTSERYAPFYGNICTEKYYYSAVKYMKEKVNNCRFYFFSDDIEEIKEHYKMDNAVYVEKAMFDGYEDWYDMYLMSICKHNIIANSTFSWWGAWLNRHEDKIVIAPEKWINSCDYQDIYPKGWMQMS